MIDLANIVLAAQKVLNKEKNKNGNITFPINPFEILNDNGVLIEYSNFEKLEGLLMYDESKSLVAININRPIKRQRFTAAHELGHLMLHTNLESNQFIYPIYGVKSNIEKEADSFASNLLMTTDELNRQIDIY